MDQEVIKLAGELKGHKGWVTAIATPLESTESVLSASRDKTIIVWKITRGNSEREGEYGEMQKRLVGHHHFVQDISISSDGQYALSASWDGTLRLWNLSTGQTTQQFRDHAKDVLSAAFSGDNRQIVSGSRDNKIKLWNTVGQCKYTMGEAEGSHQDWVTCVRFSPNNEDPVIVSAGCDHLVKVWNLNNCKLKFNLKGHTGHINTVDISPDGSLCASGGKDGKAMLWDLNEGKSLSQLDAGAEINALTFSPNRYWLCAATGGWIKIWDLESKAIVDELKPDFGSEPSKKAIPIQCTSLAWSADGQTLYAGYTDNIIRVWNLSHAQ